MRATGSAATCVPVQMGGSGEWETALFLHVAGPECKQDRRTIKTATSPTPVEISPKLMAHSSAAIVSIDLSVRTVPDDPLKYEVLLIPGREETHYQAIKLLSRQQHICCFFGDNDFKVIQAHSQEIEPGQHELFETIARDAFAHDSLLRISNQYNSDEALTEIASHYTPRSDAGTGVKH